MEKGKSFAKGFIRYLFKMFIVAIVALIISFIISLKVEMSLKEITVYMALGLILIGGMAAMGSSMADGKPHRQAGPLPNLKYSPKDAMKRKDDSFRFTIFMLGTGGIVALISWIL